MRAGIAAASSVLLVCLALAWPPSAPAQEDLEADLKAVRDAWGIASYRTPTDAHLAAFEALRPRAAALVEKYPGRAEPLIWHGIVLSSYARARGGLGSLGAAEEAKARFESALALDEKALGGAAHTSLGALYHRVPGFPISFGSDAKSRLHFEKALAINPDGIDPNYFYGELLYDEGEYARALEHLERALRAPPRPGREMLDEGRREEVRVLLAKTREEI